MALALKPTALALALVLRAAWTFWHHSQTQGPATTAKVKLKVCLGRWYSIDK